MITQFEDEIKTVKNKSLVGIEKVWKCVQYNAQNATITTTPWFPQTAKSLDLYVINKATEKWGNNATTIIFDG